MSIRRGRSRHHARVSSSGAKEVRTALSTFSKFTNQGVRECSALSFSAAPPAMNGKAPVRPTEEGWQRCCVNVASATATFLSMIFYRRSYCRRPFISLWMSSTTTTWLVMCGMLVVVVTLLLLHILLLLSCSCQKKKRRSIAEDDHIPGDVSSGMEDFRRVAFAPFFKALRA